MADIDTKVLVQNTPAITRTANSLRGPTAFPVPKINSSVAQVNVANVTDILPALQRLGELGAKSGPVEDVYNRQVNNLGRLSAPGGMSSDRQRLAADAAGRVNAASSALTSADTAMQQQIAPLVSYLSRDVGVEERRAMVEHLMSPPALADLLSLPLPYAQQIVKAAVGENAFNLIIQGAAQYAQIVFAPSQRSAQTQGQKIEQGLNAWKEVTKKQFNNLSGVEQQTFPVAAPLILKSGACLITGPVAEVRDGAATVIKQDSFVLYQRGNTLMAVSEGYRRSVAAIDEAKDAGRKTERLPVYFR